jgi:hypothetical protein
MERAEAAVFPALGLTASEVLACQAVEWLFVHAVGGATRSTHMGVALGDHA